MAEEWIVPGKNRRLVKPRGADRRVKLTGSRRKLFLDHLAATCNVTAAAAAAGVSFSAVYRCRARDPEFRRQWADALDQGYAVLEAALLDQAVRKQAAFPPDGGEDGRADGVEIPPAALEVDWAKGMELLRQHQRGLAGGTTNYRTPERVPVEKLAAKLVRKIKAIGVRLPEESGGR